MGAVCAVCWLASVTGLLPSPFSVILLTLLPLGPLNKMMLRSASSQKSQQPQRLGSPPLTPPPPLPLHPALLSQLPHLPGDVVQALRQLLRARLLLLVSARRECAALIVSECVKRRRAGREPMSPVRPAPLSPHHGCRCIHQAMSVWQKSNCPLCRSEYSYFPWVRPFPLCPAAVSNSCHGLPRHRPSAGSLAATHAPP